jgi:hypothetical protein
MRFRLRKVAFIAAVLLTGAVAMPNTSIPEKIGGVLLSRVPANIAGAQREKNIAAKLLKASTGWSMLDMERYGWRGGPGSIINDPCGTLCNAVFSVTWKPAWAPTQLDP